MGTLRGSYGSKKADDIPIFLKGLNHHSQLEDPDKYSKSYEWLGFASSLRLVCIDLNGFATDPDQDILQSMGGFGTPRRSGTW